MKLKENTVLMLENPNILLNVAYVILYLNVVLRNEKAEKYEAVKKVGLGSVQ